MAQGMDSLFFVVLIVALITGAIGDIPMINVYAESIHDQIIHLDIFSLFILSHPLCDIIINLVALY